MVYEFLNYPENLQMLAYIVSIFHRDTHFHTGMEILYVLEGPVIITKRNETAVLHEGDIYVVERKALHSLKCTDQPNSILVVQFDTKFCNSFFPNFSRFRVKKSLVTPDSGAAYERLKSTIREFLQHQQGQSAGFPFLMMSSLNKLCAILIDDIGMCEMPEEEIEAQERNLTRLGRIIDYVNKNYMYKITLKQIAEQEKLNMCYLSHFVTQQLGMSFQKYLTRVRTQSAAALLVSTNKRILDICIECGFSDSRYLNKAFLEEYGMTPLQFRKTQGSVTNRILADALGPVTQDQHCITPIGGRIAEIIRKM